MTTILKDTKIVCSRKHHPIGLTMANLKGGDPLKLSAIWFAIGQNRIQGEEPNCKICGSPYFLAGQVHTDQGWRPNEPKMDPVKQKKDFSLKRDRKLGKEEEKAAKALAKFQKDKKDKQDNHPNHP